MGCSPSSILRCMQAREKLDGIPVPSEKLEQRKSLVKTDLSERFKNTDDYCPRLSLQISEKSSDPSRQTLRSVGSEEEESIAEGLESRIRTLPEEDGEVCVIKGPQDLKSNLLTSWSPSSTKIMLVFGRDDHQSEVLGSAAKKLGWSVTYSRSTDTALETFHSRGHDIVVIDHRGSRGIDSDSLCRSIRASGVNPNTVIVALVRKSFLINADQDQIMTIGLMGIGFNRTLLECSQENLLANELVNIHASELQPRLHLAAFHALYVAVDRCRDMVHVTNDRHVVQFANKASERFLGYKPEELLGNKIMDIVSSDNFVLMDQHLRRGREWEGNMNCKRKSSKTITINCRIVPFSASGRTPTHYIYVHDTTYLLENMAIGPGNTGTQQMPRGSVHSLRRGSFDVKSTGSESKAPDLQTRFSYQHVPIENQCQCENARTHRRSSFTKIHNLPLEAPITRVIGILSTALNDMSTTSPELALQMYKAIELLKGTELYTPQLREDTRGYDPVTEDLVGALLASPVYARDSRRSSNDSVSRIPTSKTLTNASAHRMSLKGYRPPQEIHDMMEKSLDWDFDIFKLEVLSCGRPLVYLGMNLIGLYEGPATLGCDEKTFFNWLTLVEMHYHADNSYHNSSHAADVLQATAKFMRSERLKMIFDPLDEVTALIAAAAHDIDHPGRSSQFLCNANNKLAILYNDLAVLESHHAALTFKLTLADDRANIFKGLDRESYKVARQNVIDMILATEMTRHFEHLAKFVNVCSNRMAGDSQSEPVSEVIDMTVLLQPENITLVKRMMIKCADVSNPTRPLKACIEWARRIAEEYFRQTDEEKQNGMPVVMPMFDRLTCSIPKSQIGFVDFIINDMVEAWDTFVDMPELISHMRLNYDKWKEYQEQGISTLQDIEKLQTSPELQIPRRTT
ncbi:high affinity cAMP-specific and IBMX-insensitive 3',5'-cyclic phosphodiesterase 8A isoform X2 [Neodiprion pinetum]|uniref:high affinity cAMP-specific and IBMX-insensitive 3',5'-cyclic phosphodiesterase 8A isoform X2 n=1 Tax=Neodiprion pinetum TaxID=441929 RepID=UPI001EDD475A|nr:high affinity cAMP-specific and IBMX-insensitive 3',5'-cyclic phosphodiesterase 8A-like isoform X2 [Neodiprion pinetum]